MVLTYWICPFFQLTVKFEKRNSYTVNTIYCISIRRAVACTMHVTYGWQLLYAETPSNPIMTVLDMEKFGQLGSHDNDDDDDDDEHGGHHRERLTVVDATFASPQLLKPMKYGVDIVIHSAYVTHTDRNTHPWA